MVNSQMALLHDAVVDIQTPSEGPAEDLSAILERRNEVLESLHASAHLAMNELDTRELCTSFARASTKVACAQHAILCLREPDGLALRAAYPEESGDILFARHRNLLVKALQRHRAHIHSLAVERPDAYLDPFYASSLLIVPVIDHQRQVVGLIATQNSLSPSGFCDSDIRALETMALQFSTALSRSKLFDRLQDWSQSLEMLLAFNTAINQHLTPNELVNRLVENATNFLKADGGMAGFAIPSGQDGGLVMASEAFYSQGKWHPLPRRWLPKEGVPGSVLETEFVYLSNNYPVDPAADPELIARFNVQQVLCVPIKDVAGKMLGFFALYKIDRSTPFTWQDAAFLETLGNSTAVAIQNAQLLKTLELKNYEIRALSIGHVHHLEEERRQIARELHDEAGQVLVGIQLGLQVLARKVPADVDGLAAELDRIRKLVNESGTQLRDLARNLRPPTLDKLGLVVAIQQLADEYERHSNLAIALHFDPLPDIMPEPIRTSLYRIVQEALTNVAKHGGASSVAIRISVVPQGLKLSVQDNGRGFDPNDVHSGLGLLGMKERAGMLGGQLELQSKRGVGTTICISIPLR